MALKPVDGPPGPPWERPLAGTLDKLVVESEVLAGNPLGDPARRPLYVYSSPRAAEAGERVPTVYVIQGFTGQLDSWLAREAFEPSNVERYDALWAGGGEEVPPGVLVFVDARYPTVAAREGRAIAGKSSGGYGAMVVPMLRPDVFGALASHAGDALFECSMLSRFPHVARTMRDHFDSSYDVFFERLREAPQFDFGRFGEAIELYAYACAYSPDPASPTGRPRMPFDLRTGRLVEEVWAQWLEHDPVRMVRLHAEELRSMRRIYLDAGRSDDAFLDLGAQAVSDELTRAGIEHTLELFEGRHGGISWRYPIGVRELLRALSE